MLTRILLTLALMVWGLSEASSTAFAEQRNEVYWPQKDWTYKFSEKHLAAYQLFNAFDYGHGILYEKLYVTDANDIRLLEEDVFTDVLSRLAKASDIDGSWLTRVFKPNPYRFPLDEELIAPTYSRFAWRAMNTFDWTHVLHARTYDVMADERLSPAQKDAALKEELQVYYSKAPGLAFAKECKDMDLLMDGQYYSLAFRKAFPKFNALIWAYHWLQLAVYDALLEEGKEASSSAVTETLLRFARTVAEIEHPAHHGDHGEDARIARMKQFAFAKALSDQKLRAVKAVPVSSMPMAHMSSPRFTRAYPEFAAIFDNLHIMHDVISDVLVSKKVQGRAQKRQELDLALDRLQDPKAYLAPCMGSDTPGHGGGHDGH